MFEAIALLFSFILLVFNYSVNKDIFYPPAMFTLVWTIVLISYIIFSSVNQGEAYFLDGECLLIFVLGEITFTTGGLFAVRRKLLQSKINYAIGFKYWFDKMVFFFLLIMLPLYIYRLQQIVGASSFEAPDANFFLILRFELIQGSGDLGLLAYLNTFAAFAFSIALYKFNFTKYKSVHWTQKAYKYLFYFLIVTYAILSTARTGILLLFCIYLGFKVVSGKLKTRHYIAAGLLFFLVFGIFAIVLHKGGGEFLSLTENVKSVLLTFSVYFLGGTYGLNSVIKQGYTLDYGKNSFRFFTTLFDALGIISTNKPETKMPFITNPILSNVYSIYYVYIKDFWYFGLIFNSIWSFLHSWLYYRAKINFFNLFMYAALIYPLVISFFDEQYLQLLSSWIQLIFYATLASFFIEYKSSTENNNAS